MKIQKDVAFALATVAGALVALFALFVTIPVWFEAVVITLTAVGAIATVTEIVKAYKASIDPATGKHTYKFPFVVFILGSLILVAVTAIVLLSLKRLFGFALIPVAALLAILLVIAVLKKLRIMTVITGVLLAILVVALVGYFTSALVHSGVNLNPGISTGTEASENEASEPNKPVVETKNIHFKVYMPKEVKFGEAVRVVVEGANASEFVADYGDAVSVALVSDSELAVTINRTIYMGRVEYTVNDNGFYEIRDEAANRVYTLEVIELTNETNKPETEKPETNKPETEKPETNKPETEKPETNKPETEKPETNKPETEKSETNKPETEKPETNKPETEKPETEKPETGDSEIKGEDVETGDTDSKDDYVPVVVKINAPKTMSYAEPICITVEGTNVHNLKFDNEDFLAIVVISDTEVEVTLIGIVNDAGEVELEPADRHITVTDTVTGVNATIEIVE